MELRKGTTGKRVHILLATTAGTLVDSYAGGVGWTLRLPSGASVRSEVTIGALATALGFAEPLVLSLSLCLSLSLSLSLSLKTISDTPRGGSTDVFKWGQAADVFCSLPQRFDA